MNGFERLGRRPTLMLLFATAMVVVCCGTHPPFGTAARYLLTSKEMVESGDWVIPHLGHVAYFEKPILTFWLGALSQLAFGGSWLAAQLPAGLAVLVMLITTCAIGTRMRSPGFGLAAALLLLSSGFMIVMATTLTTDSILSACLAVAWWSFLRFDETQRQRWRLLFWLALALGWLAKGPIALLLPALALGGFGLLDGGLRGLWRLARQLGIPTGLAIVVAVNLPWTLLVWQQDPRLLEFFYVRCNLKAFSDGTVHHPGPFWYYAPALLGTLLPLSPLVLPAAAVGCARAARGRAADDEARRIRRFLACIVVLPLLFLSVSASKLAAYPMPLLPALVLLGLDVLVEWNERRSRAASWLLGLVAGVMFVGSVGASVLLLPALRGAAWLPVKVQEQVARFVPDASVVVVVIVLLAGSIGTFVLARRRQLLAGLTLLAATATTSLCVVMPNVGRLAPELDPRPALAALRTERKPDEPIYLHEHVVQQYLVHFFVGERMRIVDHCRELGLGHFVEVRGPEVPLPAVPDSVDGGNLPDHPWLSTRDRLAQAWAGAGRVWLLGGERIVDELRKRGLTVYEKGRSEVVILATNRP